jgi:hypothetical protein
MCLENSFKINVVLENVLKKIVSKNPNDVLNRKMVKTGFKVY